MSKLLISVVLGVLTAFLPFSLFGQKAPIFFLYQDTTATFEDQTATLLESGFYPLLEIDAKNRVALGVIDREKTSYAFGYALVENFTMLNNPQAYAVVFPNLPITEKDLSKGVELLIQNLRKVDIPNSSNLFPSFYFYKVEYPKDVYKKALVERESGEILLGKSLERAKRAFALSKVDGLPQADFLKLLKSPLQKDYNKKQVLLALGEPNFRTLQNNQETWLYWEYSLTWQKDRLIDLVPR